MSLSPSSPSSSYASLFKKLTVMTCRAANTTGQGINVRPHPHINLATVTYLFEGEILHRDSLGSHQVIRPGDINLMLAGRGIVHSERERAEGGDHGGGNVLHHDLTVDGGERFQIRVILRGRWNGSGQASSEVRPLKAGKPNAGSACTVRTHLSSQNKDPHIEHFAVRSAGEIDQNHHETPGLLKWIVRIKPKDCKRDRHANGMEPVRRSEPPPGLRTRALGSRRY